MLIFVYVDYYLEIIYITNLYNNLKDLLMVFFCVCLIRDLSPLFSFGEKLRNLMVSRSPWHILEAKSNKLRCVRTILGTMKRYMVIALI